MAKKLTKEEINQKLINDSRGIELIGEYKNSQTKTLFKCKNDHEWLSRPTSIISAQKNGCPHCANQFPLSKEIVNQRLSSHKIKLISDYVSVSVKSVFECKDGHQWTALPTDVLHGGHGCPHCDGQFPYTKETLNEKLKPRGIQIIGEYKNVKTKTLFLCSNKHTWMTIASHIVAGSDCPHCVGHFPYTKETLNEKLKPRGIQLIGKYKNAKIATTFQCDNNHTWNALPTNIIQGSGCPVCIRSHLNSGVLYVLHFEEMKYIKYGITSNFDRRYRELSKQGECSILYKLEFEKVYDAFLTEQKIKKILGGKAATKEELPDGYTETLPESMKDELLAILKAA
jgi:hypothetical protein